MVMVCNIWCSDVFIIHSVIFTESRYSMFQFSTVQCNTIYCICVSKLTIIGSDNGLSPGRHQATVWTNDGNLLIGTSGTNFSEILIEIHTLSCKKMHLKMSSEKWLIFCLGLNVSMTNTKGRMMPAVSYHTYTRVHTCGSVVMQRAGYLSGINIF